MMRRFLLALATVIALAIPTAPAVLSASAAPAGAATCGAAGVLTSHNYHNTYIRKTNSCYGLRAFIAGSYGYVFGNWVYGSGAISHAYTALNSAGNRVCWGYETSAGRLNTLAGHC